MMRDVLARKDQTYARTRLTFGSSKGTPASVKDTARRGNLVGPMDAGSPAPFSRVDFGSDSDDGGSDAEGTKAYTRRSDVWSELAASTGLASRASAKRSTRHDSLESAVSPHADTQARNTVQAAASQVEGAEYILAERTQQLRKAESELRESAEREQSLAKQLRRQKAPLLRRGFTTSLRPYNRRWLEWRVVVTHTSVMSSVVSGGNAAPSEADRM
jgi:hypothetical protein